MKVPDGRECKFFYGDYYRGRNFDECRALSNPEDKRTWNSSYCKSCPLPDYLRNNSCENLVYSVYLEKILIKKRIKVKAWCKQQHVAVRDPNVGCGNCHQVDLFS